MNLLLVNLGGNGREMTPGTPFTNYLSLKLRLKPGDLNFIETEHCDLRPIRINNNNPPKAFNRNENLKDQESHSLVDITACISCFRHVLIYLNMLMFCPLMIFKLLQILLTIMWQ